MTDQVDDKLSIEAEIPKSLRLNWRGGIPVLVEGVAGDYSEKGPPLPEYLFASRQSYLPHVLSATIARFRKECVVPETMQRLWFEFDEQPMQWQYPVGVLFDLLMEQSELPFRVRIRFTAPSNLRGFLPCPALEVVQNNYFHWFKQGMYIRYGSRLPFTEFRDDDCETLWNGVAGGNVDRFWTVLQRMKNYDVKAVPVRIVFRVKDTETDQTRIHCHQLAVNLSSEEIGKQTLEAIFHTEFPELKDTDYTLTCQGLHLPMDIPVEDIYTSLSHGDLFLYLALQRCNKTEETR